MVAQGILAAAHSGPFDYSSPEDAWHTGPGDLRDLVGTAGFEPATSASRTLRATKLRYVPIPVPA